MISLSMMIFVVFLRYKYQLQILSCEQCSENAVVFQTDVYAEEFGKKLCEQVDQNLLFGALLSLLIKENLRQGKHARAIGIYSGNDV